MTKQTFLKGTITLVLAGLVIRLLGFVNRIVVARLMGEEGVGLYMMAVPTLALTITMTQLGLPVAISKRVAEAEARNEQSRVKQILVVSLAVTGVLSLVFTAGMMALSHWVASTLLTDERTMYPLMAIAPIVPIVAISSVIRGYFQGKQNMRPSAISQLIEQVVRISLVAVLTSLFLPYGVEFAAAGAMISVVLGELASLVYMIILFKKQKTVAIRKGFMQSLSRGKSTLYDLMSIALPTTGSRLVGSVSYFFEPIVVAQSLAIAGVATVVATQQYGELTGFAMPLLFLPSFITHALSISLVPAISEAAAKKQTRLIHYRLQQALRLCMVTGGLSVVVLFLYAEPLMELMYGSSSGARFIELMAPLFLLYYFQGPLQSTLQALDMAKAAMINSIIGTVLKIVAIFALATQASIGIMGVAMAIMASTILVTLLHFFTVAKTIGFVFYFRDFIKTIIAMGAAVAAGSVWFVVQHEQLLSSTLLSIVWTSLLYVILMVAFKLIKRSDVNRIPFVGKWLFTFMPKG
ncbi:stage V sporulation protein B [Aureibacillus halotolerans]|uniref:Stage V sporulation protein B n=1 Tax=Aureibacillus halotolerans TaxID=1508390 RepID=A0A4V3D4Z1_9BACI|nr:stage V sporulation protein B [Aureibacillus halotolerans]TDQ37987.1 stage V sporulation protein B [Aureibacillus halotolerans]